MKMPAEQKIRACLFYLSVFIFLIGLPFTLSFALGYKFDRRTLKFTKTGLIALKTQPSGASINLDGKALNLKTPATIAEILPGKYTLRLDLEKHYPWLSEVNVDAGKVTRLEKIILFPLRPNIKQLNSERLSSFWVDEEQADLYYISPEDNYIYRTDPEGRDSEIVTEFLPIQRPSVKWKFSPDKGKILYFNSHQAGIAYLGVQNKIFQDRPFILEFPEGGIIDIFWHSDSFHLILVSRRGVQAVEARPGAEPVVLVNLNKRNTSSFYDARTDTLFFLDSQRAEDGKLYDNLYKLELSLKTFPFQEFIRLRTQDEE